MSAVASEIQVGDRTREFARVVKGAARKADNEEELRIEMESAIRNLASDLDMSVDPENERTVLSGRPDAVYGDLLIEYKDPNHPGDWEKEALYGRNESDSGLIDYMYDIATERSTDELEQEVILDGMVGVGTNGFEIFFCRYRPQKRIEPIDSQQATITGGISREEVTGAVELVDVYNIEDGARAFLTYLRSLSRKPLTSSKLADSFGPDGDVAQEAVREFYSVLQNAREDGHPRIETLYSEWDRVFGIVYGEDISQVQDDRQDFGTVYGVENPDVKPLLFAVHTYYGLLMKMLVTELLAVVREAPIEEAGLYEPNDDVLERKLREMEEGKQYERAGLYDFFEEGFFGWYLDVWNSELATQVRSMAEEKKSFEPATPTIKPEVVRDILKDLYQDLVPEVIRHDLGEYLTPDWLAEYIIDQTDYEGEGRILDPACGSGTFLVEAIDKIKRQSDKEGEELLDEILANVVGFDLNPVSVIAARTNYLMGLGELAFHSTSVRIPVFQCDSILSPSEYIDVTSGGKGYKIETREEEFRIPKVGGQRQIESLLSLVDEYVDMDAESKEFVEVVKSEFDTDDNNDDVIRELYSKIHGLEEENRDGVWTELLRNRLAPEFVDEFDFVVGNPPYVNWENLSQDYRSSTESLWENYSLFEFSGYDARISRDDVSILMTYVAADQYLKDDGQLGFIVPQSLFKSHRGGYGFRRFTLPKRKPDRDEEIPLSIKKVSDLSRLNPFEGVSNQTAIFTLQKGDRTEFPVPYSIWNPQESISEKDASTEVLDKVDIIDVVAEPVDDSNVQSEWLTLEPKAIDAVRKILGESELKGREGVLTSGADGTYHIELLEDRDNKALIENLPKEGRQRSIRERGVIQREVEKSLIYPTVKGRHINRWGRDGALHLLLPHENRRGPHNGIPESTMRKELRKGYQYFQEWEDILRETRERNSKFYDPDVDPFYVCDNVGEYTFAPYKTAWREISAGVQSTVLQPIDAGLGEKKPVANTHKVMFVPFWDEEAAHFACAVMNSSLTELIIRGYASALTGLSPHILETIDLPEYDENDEQHQQLAEFSMTAHEKDGSVNEIEEQIDHTIADMWNLSEAELKDVWQSLEELP